MAYNWSYGENPSQVYYDMQVGKDYLCVLSLKHEPGTWYGYVNSQVLMNKTANDKQRKKERVPMGTSPLELRSISILGHKDPEYMKQKVAQAYELGCFEIDQ